MKIKTEIAKFINHILKSKLLILGFVIYFLFNISALTNHWFDFFFFGSSVHHCCQGLDFYQIPNAAYAFFNGGELSGKLPAGIVRYSEDYVANRNVYHPLLTVTLGSFFILFDPDISIRLWTYMKIFITIGAVYYIYENFKKNKYLNFALFIFLINFSQYNEIRISQYQFLFNIFFLFLLINIAKNKNALAGGILFFLTLISKPIGLLWIPALFIKKRSSIVLTGISLFLISTITFDILGVGKYYVNNIISHFFHPVNGNSIDYMSLDALLRNTFNLPSESMRNIKIFSLAAIYLLALIKKINILTIIFLLTVYFLLFYDYLFQYHFSVLGPLLSICLLAVPQFQTKISRFLIILINLPTVFFILRLFRIYFVFDPIYGPNPTMTGWQIVSSFQILPILFLSVAVLLPQVHYANKIRLRK